MLAKNPLDRFSDATAVLVEIERFEALVRAPTGAVQQIPFAGVRRRRRGGWATGVVVAAAVVAGAIVGSGVSPRAAIERALPFSLTGNSQAAAVVQTKHQIRETAESSSTDAAEPSPRLAKGDVSERVAVAAEERDLGLDPIDLDLPIELAAGQFRAGKQSLYAAVRRSCHSGGSRRTVKVQIRVDPAGHVSRATVWGGMSKAALGRCVRRRAKAMRFPATEFGGRYVYTLRLR